MNVVVNSQALAAELRLINRVVPAKPAIAILSHVLIDATGGADPALWATDLEVGLTCSCPMQVNEPGSVVLPAAKLLALVEQFVDGDVAVASDGKQVLVRCGAFRVKLQAMPVADLPRPPAVEGATSTLDGAALRSLIERTRYAVDAGSSKYVLKGALLTLAGPVAAMAATDGHRLALATVGRMGPDAKFIVPAKTLDALMGHLDGDCEVTVGERHLSFATGGRVLISRTIDGQFPAYDRIIPRDNDTALELDRGALTAALKRINLVSDANGAVYFDLQPGALTLRSSSAEVGTADEVIPTSFAGQPMKVCMNGGYVLDFLTAAASGTVTMALKDAQMPALFTDGASHLGVIMPMRV